MTTTDFDHYSQVYQGIQRTYRNSVVGHLRERLDWVDVCNCIHYEELVGAFESALSARDSGVLSTSLEDEFDVLGVNHFQSLFEKYFDRLFPDLATSPNKSGVRRELISNATKIKAVRDPMSHPSDEDLSARDAHTQLDAAARVLERIDPVTAAAVGQMAESVYHLDANVAPHDEPQPDPLLASLPPHGTVVGAFVGRTKELDALNAWLMDEPSPVKALIGDGGKGKSSIAYQFAAGIAEDAPEPFKAVLWLTAKRRAYIDGKSVEIGFTDFDSLDSAVDTLLKAIGASDSDLSQRLEERKELLLDNFLGEFPVLVIADDIDSLEGENEDAIEFFTWEIPRHSPKSKVLITTRRQPFGLGANSIIVEGFDSVDGHRFIDDRMTRMHIPESAISPSLKDSILAACDSSPLFVEDLLRLIASGEQPADAIRRWSQSAGTSVRQYALNREVELLSADARDVLMAAAMNDGPTTVEQLRILSAQDEETLATSMAELQRLFLMRHPSDIEGVLHVSMNSNTSVLVREVFSETDNWTRIQNVFREVTSDAPHRRSIPRVKDAITQALFLSKSDRYEEAEETLLNAIEVAESATLQSALGYVYKIWWPTRRSTDARSAFKRASDLESTDIRTYVHWTMVEFDEHEYSAAIEVAKLGQSIRPDSRELLYWEARARDALARSLSVQAQPSRALDELNAASDLLMRAQIPLDEIGEGWRDYEMNSKIYRARALVFEQMLRTVDYRDAPRTYNKIQGELCDTLRSWTSEHFQDSTAITESTRLSAMFGCP